MMGYCEVSSKENQGVTDAFNFAIGSTVFPIKKSLIPPKKPKIQIPEVENFEKKELTEIHSKLKDFYNNSLFSDVKFIFKDGKSIMSHKVLYLILLRFNLILDCSIYF